MRRILFSGILLLSFVSSAFGIKIVTQNSSGAPEGCLEIITVKVNVANLTDEINGQYFLPDGYTNISLHYTYGNQSGVEHIISYLPDGNSGAPHYVPLFKWEFQIGLDLNNYCTGDCEAFADWSFSLHLPDGSYYPVKTYGYPGDIFTCEVFDLTYCQCPGNCSGFPSNPPLWEGTKILDCTACDSDCGQRGNKSKSHQIKQAARLFPNPFTSDFVFETDIPEPGEVQLTILDTNGKTVKSVTDVAPDGIYRKRIFTDNWPSGIYFVQVKVSDQVQTYRMLKMD